MFCCGHIMSSIRIRMIFTHILHDEIHWHWGNFKIGQAIMGTGEIDQ